MNENSIKIHIFDLTEDVGEEDPEIHPSTKNTIQLKNYLNQLFKLEELWLLEYLQNFRECLMQKEGCKFW